MTNLRTPHAGPAGGDSKTRHAGDGPAVIGRQSSALRLAGLRTLDLPGELTVADALGIKAVIAALAARRRGDRPLDAALVAGADCIESVGLGLARRKAGIGPMLIHSRRDDPSPAAARSAV